MSDLIIVNCFKNPDKNIDINIESLNKEFKSNKLIIFNNDDEITENNIINNYFINCISNEKNDSKIENLIFKNIKIDISKSNIQFKCLKSLSLKNSLIFFSGKPNFCCFENIDNITIKGDLDNIKKNLSNLKGNNFLKNIKEITLKQ